MSTSQPELPEQAASATIRIATLEQRVSGIQQQLAEYERSREIELKLQNFRDQILQVKTEVAEIRKDQAEINTKLVTQAMTQQSQAMDARASQDKIQIRILISIVSFVATILGGVILYILTHLHP